jgi:ABC-type sulfate/molybdate transport systems ATPase subunit
MGFALKLRGVSADERRKKVEEAAKVLDLTEHLDRKPAKLSGGQRQRVAMGRAIVREPQVFCMDEPLSNLDAKLRVADPYPDRRAATRLGTTTVYVTHDQVEAMTMGDRVAVLRFGKLQQFAAPNELYDSRPSVRRRLHRFARDESGDLPVTADGVKIGDSTLELEREHLTKLTKRACRRSPSESGPSNSTSPIQVAWRSSSTWSRTSAARRTCTRTRAPASSWWRGATRARRPSWPTRSACAGIPKGWCTCSIPKTGERIN